MNSGFQPVLPMFSRDLSTENVSNSSTPRIFWAGTVVDETGVG